MSVDLDFCLSCGYTSVMAGRPKKPKNETRDNVLRIRLTDDERKALDQAALAVGLETSTWARFELLALAQKIRKKRGLDPVDSDHRRVL